MAMHDNKYILKTGTCVYVTPEEARDMRGIRLALTVGAFNPWGQAVKKMLEYKGLKYVAVAQVAGEANEALVAWTGSRNAPTLVNNNDPALVRWLDQIAFIENCKPSPAVLPRDSEARAITIGICNELAGEWGLGWCRRLMLLDMYATGRKSAGEGIETGFKTVMDAYGYADEGVEAPAQRVADIVGMITRRMQDQKAKGSEFLVGNTLTAADVYWACFSNMIEPLPNDLCQIPDEMREHRTPKHPLILAAKNPMILEHRDRMFRQHLGRPEF